MKRNILRVVLLCLTLSAFNFRFAFLLRASAIRAFCAIALCLASVQLSTAQKFPERKIAREGNELFEKGDLAGAAARYEAALGLREEFTEARYNLGNAMLGTEKIDEAIEQYKAVLRLTPDDRDAKYNLAYAQKLKRQQDEQQQEKPQDQPQEPEQPQDGQGDQQPQQDGQQPQEPRQGQGDGQPKEGQGQPQMSSAEGEAMLEAMQAEEDKTKQEMDAQKIPAAPRSGKNW